MGRSSGEFGHQGARSHFSGMTSQDTEAGYTRDQIDALTADEIGGLMGLSREAFLALSARAGFPERRQYGAHPGVVGWTREIIDTWLENNNQPYLRQFNTIERMQRILRPRLGRETDAILRKLLEALVFPEIERALLQAGDGAKKPKPKRQPAKKTRAKRPPPEIKTARRSPRQSWKSMVAHLVKSLDAAQART